jgi:predicted ATP-binding protein involved in virulence
LPFLVYLTGKASLPMKSKLTIKNFRIFDSVGQTFEINPITILTGCNSSGKSSLVKSIALFSDWLNRTTFSFQRDNFDELFKIPLNFNLNYLKLGSFSDSANNFKTKDHFIQFSIVQYSSSLATDIIVDYCFTSRKSDIADNAWLYTLKVTEYDGAELFSLHRGSNPKFNLEPIKRHLLRYIQYEDLRADLSISTKAQFQKEHIRSQYGRTIYDSCLRIKDFKEKVSSYIEIKYPQKYNDSKFYKKLRVLSAYDENFEKNLFVITYCDIL